MTPDLPDPDHELAGVRHEQAFHAGAFVGREALLAAIDAFLDERPRGGALLLTGGPGAGKSAIAAAVAARHAGRGALLHMIKSHRSPRRFVPALIAQAARLSGARFGAAAYVGDVDDLRDALCRALEAVRAQAGRALLVIDGLDELEPADARLAFLPAALPEGVHLVLTCRPDLPLRGAVRARVAGVEERPLPPFSEPEVAALCARLLPRPDAVDAGALFDRTGGNPLLLTRALGALARDPGARVPATLADVFADVHAEIAAVPGRADLLHLLSIAREPIGVAALAALSGLSHAACHDHVLGMSRFLLDAGDRFLPWHRGLADHVREKILGDAAVRALEARAAAFRGAPEYALRHRVAHLLAAGRPGEAAEILLDGAELEERARVGLVFDLVAELGDVARALPEGASARPVLEALAAAIRLHGHFLARHPEALFQTVHNAGSPAALGAWLARERGRKASDPGFVWLRAVRPPPLGGLLATLRGHEHEVVAVAASPERIASVAEDGTLRLWDPRTGACLHAARVSARRALAVAFSPDGRHVAVGTDEGVVRILRALDGAEVAAFPGHAGPVWAVAFTPDGHALASGGRDRAVRMRRADGTPVWERPAPGVITALAVSPDGGRLAVGTAAPRVLVLDAASGDEVAALDDLDETPWGLSFSPDDGRLAVASADGSVRVLGAGLSPLAELSLPDERLWACAFSPDGARVACAGTGRRVHLWTPGSDAAPVSFPAHEGWIHGVTFSPDGAALVSASADRSLRLQDARAEPVPEQGGVVTVTAFSHRGRHLAVGFHDGRVELRDAERGTTERRLSPHARRVNAVAFSPDDRLLASAARDGTVVVHRVDGRPLARLIGHEGAVTGLAFAPDGSRVITGGSDTSVRLWTLLGARQTHRFEHGDVVTALALSADGRLLAAGARGGEVRLFDLPGGVEVARFAVPDDGGGRGGEADPRLRDVARVEISGDAAEITVTARSFAVSTWALDPAPRLVGVAPASRVAAGEVAIRDADGRHLAYYPLPSAHVQASPSGRAWVAWEGAQVHLVVLERG